jgi:hypothetical protein
MRNIIAIDEVIVDANIVISEGMTSFSRFLILLSTIQDRVKMRIFGSSLCRAVEVDGTSDCPSASKSIPFWIDSGESELSLVIPSLRASSGHTNALLF